MFDGRRPDVDEPRRTDGPSGRTVAGGERDFLVRVQRELEDQRDSWRPEIDRLCRGTIQLTMDEDGSRGSPVPGSGRYRGGGQQTAAAGADVVDRRVDSSDFLGAGSSFDAGTNSYVDTATPGGIPIFKAFVDVSEYDPSEVTVTVDKMTNKIVVEAESGAAGGVARSFTQRIQLPRFADDARLIARMNQRGILKLEVPLIYYFPPTDYDLDREGRAKSFVYEVRDDPTDPSRQLMEILVNTGRDVSARDLRVEVADNNRLVVSAERSAAELPSNSNGTSGPGRSNRMVIKRYALPPLADVTAITSRLGSDGRLTILIPIRRK